MAFAVWQSFATLATLGLVKRFLPWYICVYTMHPATRMSHLQSMRILSQDFVLNIPPNRSPIKGGVDRFARDFSDFVVANGHEWIGFLKPSNDYKGIECLAKVDNRSFFSLPGREIGTAYLGKFNSTTEITKDLERDIDTVSEFLGIVRPDVIFFNGFVPAHVWTLFVAASRAGIPMAFQHAGIFIREVEMYKDILPPEYLQLIKEIEREVTKKVSANIFLNRHSQNAFAESAGEVASEAVVIPLPHANWPFSPISKLKEAGNRTIGLVSRWDRIKNQESVLELAKKIRELGLPWKIVSVVHIPDTGKRVAFKSQYRELIEVHPHMDREALRSMYATFDMCILPSHFETAGGVVMEALAQGKPTLVSPHTGWVEEYRKHGMKDWVIDFEDSSLVVEHIKALFDRQEWPELNSFASYIQSAHDPYKVFSQYLSLFGKLIHN